MSKRMSNRKREKTSYPHQKRVSNRKKKTPLAQEKRKQTILKCLDFLPSLFKRPVCHGQNKKNKTHQSTIVAVDVCRASCGSRVRRALVVGRRSLAYVICWSAAVALENVACGCRVRRQRQRPRRRSSHWRLLLVVLLKRRNSGMVGSGQPNPCRARFLK